MRFKVGKETLFVQLTDPTSGAAEHKHDSRQLWEKFPFSIKLGGLYDSDGSELSGKEAFVFKRLTCTQHHKVPAVGPDVGKNAPIEFDGYVFVDEGGCPWHNQYPLARQEKIEPAANGIVLKVGGFGKMVSVRYCFDYLESIDDELRALIAHGEPFRAGDGVMSIEQRERNRELRLAALAREEIRELRRLLRNELHKQFDPSVEQL